MKWRGYKSLREAFAYAATPELGDLKGYYAVRLVTGILPDIRFFSHCKFFPEDMETKRGGFNEFLGLLKIGNFSIEKGDSILGDGQRVLRINYSRPGNPFWLKPLNDELKQIAKGFYLGRGIYCLKGYAFNTFYFSVEKIA